MNNEWKALKTLQDVASAQADGDVIEYITDPGNYKYEKFKKWEGGIWVAGYEYRSRPAKKVKKIVLREALMHDGHRYYTKWQTVEGFMGQLVKWLDTPERIVEIEE